eukprot:755625-Hanusia_phi.AAC.2
MGTKVFTASADKQGGPASAGSRGLVTVRRESVGPELPAGDSVRTARPGRRQRSPREADSPAAYQVRPLGGSAQHGGDCEVALLCSRPPTPRV